MQGSLLLIVVCFVWGWGGVQAGNPMELLERSLSQDLSIRSANLYFLAENDASSYITENRTVIKVCDERYWSRESVERLPSFFGRAMPPRKCYVGCSVVTPRPVNVTLWKVLENSQLEQVTEIKTDLHTNYNPTLVHQAYTNAQPRLEPVTYICRAQDNRGEIIEKSLQVHFYRSIELRISQSYIERVNSTAVRITCVANGRPPPSDVTIQLIYRLPTADSRPSTRRVMKTIPADPDQVDVEGSEVRAYLTAPLEPDNNDLGVTLNEVACFFNQGPIQGPLNGARKVMYLFVPRSLT